MATNKVYAAIAAVMADMSKEGISKGRRNQQQGYNFRGIDDVYNALSPILAKHGLCILPRILSRQVIERTTQKGGVLFYVTVEAEFDLVCAEDGSTHTVRTFGEAMDSGDKATNKAMSAAYKYAAMQAFAIPTEGDNDADATTHEVAPAPSKDTRDAYTGHLNAITSAKTMNELLVRFNAAKADKSLSPTDAQDLIDAKDAMKENLSANSLKGFVPPSFDQMEKVNG